MHGLSERTGDGVNAQIAEAADALIAPYLKRQKMPQQWLADMLGANATTFSNYLNDQRMFPAALVVRLTQRCGTGLIQELARLCGGIFISTPREGGFGTGHAAYAAACKLLKTSGDLSTECFRALEDGELDEIEHKRIKGRIARHMEALNLLQQAIEELPVKRLVEGGE